MTLVERFIEFDRWPISRKTAVTCGFLVLVHVFTDVVAEITYAFGPADLLDITLLRWIVWPIVGFLAIAFLLSFLVHRAGHEGGWTAWLLVVPYTLFLITLTYAFGPVSSPFIVALLLAGLLAVMTLGLRIGSLAVAFGLVLTMGRWRRFSPGGFRTPRSC